MTHIRTTSEMERRAAGGAPSVAALPEPISPELVLVDPELRARVLATAVSGPTSYQEARTETVELDLAEPVEAMAAAPNEAAAGHRAPSTGARSRRRLRLGTLAVGGALLALLGAAFLPPRDGPRLLGPRAVGAAPIRDVLSWAPATAAGTGYLVEFYRGERLVHAETVEHPRLVVPEWFSPGRYAWRVFARATPTAQPARDRLLEQGWFSVS